ncbi:MAG: histidinol dehydrogenase [Candidatus Helarchaeota archaeon]
MVKILRNDDEIEKFLESISNRGKTFYGNLQDIVKKILDEVKNDGDSACLRYTRKFDNVILEPNELKIKETEIKEAYSKINSNIIQAIRLAKINIEKFHRAHVQNFNFIETSKGVKVGQIIVPFERVGIYIPGGSAPYPSTVLMTAIPAKVAGVKQIIITTPPNKNKEIHPAILVAANECGIKDIFKIGGAQAIAAMAYGTKSINKVNKIVGPGNVYVNIAKILVNQDVAIDLPAGPSEILVIADENSNPKYISDDLLSQAEHDKNAFTFLVSNSMELIQNVNQNITTNLDSYKRKDIIKKSLDKNCYLIYVKNVEQMFRISNQIAPEHLEIHLKDPDKYLPMVQNAGTVFLGEYSPVPVGDYAAGTNHVLPTGGLAKIYSGLSTYDFIKRIQIVECSKEGINNLKDIISPIAEIEGFDAHKKAINGRLTE